MKSNEDFLSFDALPKRILISATNETLWSHTLYIYNPTDRRRIELISLLIDVDQVSITSNRQRIEACQIDPQWSEEQRNTVEANQFEVNRISFRHFRSIFSFEAFHSSGDRTLFNQRIHHSS